VTTVKGRNKKLHVQMPVPEEGGGRRNQRLTLLEMEKGTMIRERLGGSMPDSLRQKNEGVKAVLEEVATW
jgi:hypothetical protein